MAVTSRPAANVHCAFVVCIQPKTAPRMGANEQGGGATR